MKSIFVSTPFVISGTLYPIGMRSPTDDKVRTLSRCASPPRVLPSAVT